MNEDKDRLERLLGKARGSFWDENGEDAPIYLAPTEKNAVTGDGFDRRAWKYMSDQMPILKGQVADLGKDYETSPAAYEDLFRVLSKGDPRMTEPSTIEAPYRPQWAIAKGMMVAPDLAIVRKQTRYDDYNTAIAILTMKDRMRKAFEELEDAIEAIQAAQRALQEAIEAAQGEQGDEGSSAAADGLEAAMAAMVAAQGQGQDAEQKLEDAAAGAVGAAKAELERQASASSAYGLSDGELKRMDFDERRRLTQRLDAGKMQHLADLVGQFRMYADAERRRKIVSAPSEIYDVETGNDLAKLTATEQINMAIPELEDLFWARWSKQGLSQWAVRGPENAGRGPILVVCDESGSMGAGLDADGNTREAWAKAVALALADQAKRGKRDFTYIGFSSQGQVWETGAKNGEMTAEMSVDFVSHFWGGGTSYERPLLRAMSIIKEYADRGTKRPDVVFITDDECRVNDEFIAKWKQDCKEADVRCYGIRVGADAREDGWKSAMRSLCDQIINVNRLTAKPEDVKALFSQI